MINAAVGSIRQPTLLPSWVMRVQIPPAAQLCNMYRSCKFLLLVLFAWSIPIRRFAMRTYSWFLFPFRLPLMPASFTAIPFNFNINHSHDITYILYYHKVYKPIVIYLNTHYRQEGLNI